VKCEVIRTHSIHSSGGREINGVWPSCQCPIEELCDPSEPVAFTVTDPLASVYTAISVRPNTVARVKVDLDLPWPTGELEVALDEFCTHGRMLREGGLFLSLALPAKLGRQA
jgi:hypothetical protein